MRPAKVAATSHNRRFLLLFLYPTHVKPSFRRLWTCPTVKSRFCGRDLHHVHGVLHPPEGRPLATRNACLGAVCLSRGYPKNCGKLKTNSGLSTPMVCLMKRCTVTPPNETQPRIEAHPYSMSFWLLAYERVSIYGRVEDTSCIVS